MTLPFFFNFNFSLLLCLYLLEHLSIVPLIKRVSLVFCWFMVFYKYYNVAAVWEAGSSPAQYSEQARPPVHAQTARTLWA